MRVSPEALAEFQEIFFSEYGEEISGVEAEEMASNMLDLCSVLLRNSKNSVG
ncbi:MAG: hypothetical protein WCJ84_04585 [Candidatus Peregrinibacteria bacterium]